MEVKTHEKHDCISKPNHPQHAKYFDESDNDNAQIAKMQDSQVRQEITRKALKPSSNVEAALQDKVEQLERDLYSLDNEFQEHKRKTERKVADLEERLKKLEETKQR